TPFESDDSIETIIKDIRHNIESNYPELTLDRLHNYLIKYGRKLCDEHGLEHTDSDTLNSLFGIYNKWLHKSELLKSKMSSKIIGTIVKLFDDFNYVRNNQSAAHPNPLLNKTESLFIVDTVCSIIEFLKRIEDVRRTP
ncbi:MAG TPA: abortive infection family protein, partial [Candidatus Cloacimonadota bacterium]|nr:abortive infection family protein [Candidatus Cloacimonadota bacterium]